MSDSFERHGTPSGGLSIGFSLVGAMLLVGLALITLGIGLGSKQEVEQTPKSTPENIAANTTGIIALPSVMPHQSLLPHLFRPLHPAQNLS